MGSSVLVITDGDPSLAQNTADAIARRMWMCRADFEPVQTGVTEAVTLAKQRTERPVVLLDMGDNVGGGSPADGTALALEALRQDAGRTFVCLHDPAAASAAATTGEGGRSSRDRRPVRSGPGMVPGSFPPRRDLPRKPGAAWRVLALRSRPHRGPRARGHRTRRDGDDAPDGAVQPLAAHRLRCRSGALRPHRREGRDRSDGGLRPGGEGRVPPRRHPRGDTGRHDEARLTATGANRCSPSSAGRSGSRLAGLSGQGRGRRGLLRVFSGSCSSSPMRWRRRPAAPPSRMRWSKLRTNCDSMRGRNSPFSSSHTGTLRPAISPRTRFCSGRGIGLAAVMPKGPTFVIVAMPVPTGALGQAALPRELDEFLVGRLEIRESLLVDVADHRHEDAVIGLDGEPMSIAFGWTIFVPMSVPRRRCFRKGRWQGRASRRGSPPALPRRSCDGRGPRP